MKKRTNRKAVLISIMLSMFMASIEGTIVATAMPNIVAELGGFSLFSWVFSVFLLMQAVTIPIYGKLSDLFGRKPVFILGITVFLVGSTLCGFARTMTALILFRLIQGFGAGAVQPIASTIVGDMYTLEERAKIQGYLSSVWGISSIVGPALGGVFVQYVHWSWVFWLNIPLGVAAIVGISLFLHEGIEKHNPGIDYAGSILLMVWVSSLILILTQGGTRFAWTSGPIILLAVVFVVTIALFWLRETRADAPVMPLRIWRNRLIAVANFASLTTGAVMIGVSSFLPTYVQGVMGYSPIVAGFTLSAMSFGWPVASAIGGRLMMKIGFRKNALIGGCSLVAGAAILLSIHPQQSLYITGAGALLIGVGMGFASTTFIVSIQSSVDWETRGAATAGNMFMRILGNTIGAALFGGLLNNRLQNELSLHGLHIPLDQITGGLLHTGKNAMLPATLHVIQQALHGSLHAVYFGVLILAVASLAIIFFLPQLRTKTAFSR
ncbi:MDR family MFS transporter [Aneurinibacillus sp. Ricciae_BoGa-3]|uniref:MDR family MFS transporter n=1 Tax=Aneurinibacillus sp. Ricciae_BoGa-3 TaxID=3022697 RepID=UPI002341EAB0|nr:MDR family MFS transporter [Aneurinibacillus sp. Ricciae_BoGa-3]WCK54940.1 MDR family MFS transporter [Aneurinibacillus sp. Ricciae_BoGa-3]